MQKSDFVKGQVLMVDKPKGMTSFDVIRILRKGLRGVKMGHAGTLDPLASGLLIICTGKMTKQIDKYQGLEKEYEGSMFVGASTPSFDLETKIDREYETSHIDNTLLEKTRQKFLGEISQRPPRHSAVKVGGKRAYKMAREGEVIEMPSRIVDISSFEILNADLEDLHFRVRCSKGTYIRSLANDFGAALNSGAYLSELRRTAIGEYRVEEARAPEEWLEVFTHLEEESPK